MFSGRAAYVAMPFLEIESSKPKKEEEQGENRMRNIMSLAHEKIKTSRTIMKSAENDPLQLVVELIRAVAQLVTYIFLTRMLVFAAKDFKVYIVFKKQ